MRAISHVTLHLSSSHDLSLVKVTRQHCRNYTQRHPELSSVYNVARPNYQIRI